MKKIKHIYLIQSEKNLDFINEENNSRVFINAVWGESPKGKSLDARNLTMPEGRNLMFEYVTRNYEFDYLTFKDGDISFIKGSYDVYEKIVEKYKLPLYHSFDISDHAKGYLHKEIDYCFERYKKKDKLIFMDWIDTCFCTFRKDIINDYMPWLTKFDYHNWWYSCFYLNILGRIKGHMWAIVLDVQTDNHQHREYPKKYNREVGDIHHLISRDFLKYIISKNGINVNNTTLNKKFPWPIYMFTENKYLKELKNNNHIKMFRKLNTGVARYNEWK